MTIEELKEHYAQRRGEIQSRLREFRDVWEAADDKRLFEELVFCIFTAGASARMGLNCVEAVRPLLFDGDLGAIADALRHRHRYPQARAEYIVHTRDYLQRKCGMNLRRLIESFSDSDARRDFFAANRGIKGLGYKEGSHFLRNIGFRGYAILDKHILRCLHEFGRIESPRPPSGKKKYLEIENRMRDFSEEVGIDFDEMDLLLWSSKTGEILK